MSPLFVIQMKIPSAKYLLTTFSLLLSATLSVCGSTVASHAPSLAEGTWIKVRAGKEGIQRLSHKRLGEWGITDTDNIVVAGFGSVEMAHTLATAPDHLPVVPVIRGDDAVYFYAEGDDRVSLTSPSSFVRHRNLYSSGSYYYICVNPAHPSPEMAVENEGSFTDTAPATNYISVQIKQHEQTTPANFGLFFFSKDFSDGSTAEFDFDISDIASDAALTCNVVGAHDEEMGLKPSFTLTRGAASSVTVKHASIGKPSSTNLYMHSSDHRMTITPDTGCDTLTLSISTGNKNFTYIAADQASLIFRRNAVYKGSEMLMHFYGLAKKRNISVKGLPSTAIVMDVTTPRSPRLLPCMFYDEGTVICPGDMTDGHSVAAFVPSPAITEPSYAGTLSGTPDLRAMESVDMLIVATDDAYTGACRLAAAHEEAQGLRTAVVRQRDILDNFSSGALHPDALRRLARILHSRPDRPLRYLLIIGETHFDTKGNRYHPASELSVHYQTEDPSEARSNARGYCADSYFGTFPDITPQSLASLSDLTLSIGVGRIPFAGSRLENVIDKYIAYLADPLLAGDPAKCIIWGGLGDDLIHMADAEHNAAAVIAAKEGVTVSRPHHGLFRCLRNNEFPSHKEYVGRLFASNPSFINFTGHGSRDAIDHYLFRLSEADRTVFGSMPVIFLASCSSGSFDQGENSLGTAWLGRPDGPAAIIAAGRSVFQTSNAHFNAAFAAELFSASPGDCIGDIYRRAFNSTGTTIAQRINNLCYNLLGDPALPIRASSGSVSAEYVGDRQLTTPVSIPALTPTRLYGSILDADGNTDTSRSGLLTVTLFESPDKAATRPENDPEGKTISFLLEETPLQTTIVNVTDGRWETVLTPPLSSVQGSNRLTMSFIGSDGLSAAGETRLLTVTEPVGNTTKTDNDPPVISITSCGSAITDRTILPPLPTFDITLSDSGSGVSINNAMIGVKPRLMIDGLLVSGTAYSFRPVSAGTYSVSYTAEGLSQGEHMLTVTARDAAGNKTEEHVTFITSPAAPPARLETAGISRGRAVFDLIHDMNDTPSARLVIRDIEGRTVTVRENATFPMEWDCTDTDGRTPLPDGTYRASAIISTQQYHTATPETEFTILR